MTSLKAMHQTKYIKAADLQNREVEVVIDRFEQENVANDGQKEEIKPVVYFRGKDKGMVLNKTNIDTLALIFGDDIEAMRGNAVVLYPTQVQFQGRLTDALRIKKAGGSVAPQSAAEATGDEIPF